MRPFFHLFAPAVLLASSLAHGAGKNPPALPIKVPALRAQITANAQAAGVWQKIDSPKLRIKRSPGTAIATITGLQSGGVRLGTAKFRDPMREAKFTVVISQNGEIAKRKGPWKDVTLHRM